MIKEEIQQGYAKLAPYDRVSVLGDFFRFTGSKDHLSILHTAKRHSKLLNRRTNIDDLCLMS
jgi:hypothetical protein